MPQISKLTHTLLSKMSSFAESKYININVQSFVILS